MEVEREARNDELASAQRRRRKQERVMEVAIFVGPAQENGNVDMGLWVHAFHLRGHLTLHRSCCLPPRVVLSATKQTELTGTLKRFLLTLRYSLFCPN